MGAPGPTIAGGRLSVGSGYIGELGGMLGATCCWLFRRNDGWCIHLAPACETKARVGSKEGQASLLLALDVG
jgi:hypothetical protein